MCFLFKYFGELAYLQAIWKSLSSKDGPKSTASKKCSKLVLLLKILFSYILGCKNIYKYK